MRRFELERLPYSIKTGNYAIQINFILAGLTNLPSWSHGLALSHICESKGYLMPVVVVESPAKAKTINKYLGSDYTVLASYGHVRDLPPKDGSCLLYTSPSPRDRG